MKSFWKYFVLFVFSTYNVADGAKFRCDYKYCSFCQAWFKYHMLPLAWQDARMMCIFEGAILASPTNLEIRATMIKSTGTFPIFTGLHSTFSKGKYFTVDGISLDEIPHKWANFQPDNVHNNESCIAFDSEGQFSDVNCDEPRPFMCYRKRIEEINECGTHDRGYELDTKTGQCYKFHTIQRTFERANFACTAEGGHLAIINSEKEAETIHDIYRKINPNTILGYYYKDVAYIGFLTNNEDGDWRTIHGQTLKEAGYDKWAPGEPNNQATEEFCGCIHRRDALCDVRCGYQFAYICEKSPNFPPVCDNNVDANLGRQGLEQAIAMLKTVRQNAMTG